MCHHSLHIQRPALVENAFTPIHEVGEFGLIERLRSVLGAPSDDRLLLGIGDDAAVYRTGPGDLAQVVTTDALVEGIHFNPSFMPMNYLGFKALSVNVSDVVAMNAKPRYATLALGLPNHIPVEQVELLYEGLRRACDLYGVTLIGGDVAAARQLTLAITAIGEADAAHLAFRRGAQPGDLLCVTGDLGASLAGLKILLKQRRALERLGDEFQPDFSAYRYVVERHLTPTARLDAVRHWDERGVRPRALIDISDGLASEVHHLCRQSGCGAVLYAQALPVDVQTRQVADELEEDVDTFALFGGEDYELLFALREQDPDQLDDPFSQVIGRFTPADEGVVLQTPSGETLSLDAGGYQHFGSGG